MSKRKLPNHISGTNREWKQRKRREWKAVLKAIDQFRLGCAYTPVYEREEDKGQTPWMKLEAETAEISKRLSFRQWGR